MNQLERIYRIHELLSHARQPMPMRRFTEELECQRNTITRDFAYMRDFLRAPLVYLSDSNGYVYDPDEPVFELPGFWMNASELYALLVCEQLLESAQPGLMAARLKPLRQRIRTLLKHSGSQADDLEHRLRIQPLYSRQVNDAVFAQIAEATLNNHQLVFEYHARSRNETRARRVSPQQLVHYRHSWYLLGWCHEANALRLFALDQISKPALQTQAAKRLPQRDIEKITASGFGIFYGEATAQAHLRFDSRSARWAAAENWHTQQKGWWEGDSYHLQFPYGNSTELVMEILRHGAGVEVLAPTELRTQVRENVKSLHEMYCSNEQ